MENSVFGNRVKKLRLDNGYSMQDLANKINVTKSSINMWENGVYIKAGRAPPRLTASHKVVPIDVSIGDEYSELIITGPNTGGKTVTLKTIGLFSLLGQSGLHIPAADNSELTVFNDIFEDDEDKDDRDI